MLVFDLHCHILFYLIQQLFNNAPGRGNSGMLTVRSKIPFFTLPMYLPTYVSAYSFQVQKPIVAPCSVFPESVTEDCIPNVITDKDLNRIPNFYVEEFFGNGKNNRE